MLAALLFIGTLMLGTGVTTLVTDLGRRATATVETCRRPGALRNSTKGAHGWACLLSWTAADGTARHEEIGGFPISYRSGRTVEIVTGGGRTQPFSPMRDALLLVGGAGMLAVAGAAVLLRRRGLPEIAEIIEGAGPGGEHRADDRPLTSPERMAVIREQIRAIGRSRRGPGG